MGCVGPVFESRRSHSLFDATDAESLPAADLSAGDVVVVDRSVVAIDSRGSRLVGVDRVDESWVCATPFGNPSSVPAGSVSLTKERGCKSKESRNDRFILFIVPVYRWIGRTGR